MARKTITLANPIEFGSEKIAVLEFANLKGKHLKGIRVGKDGMSFDDMLLVAGRMCTQPPAVMDELEGEDLAAVFEMVGDFLGGGRKTGTKQ